MDSFATTVSVALQYGVPLKDLVNKFAHVRFEPSGFTGNQEIPIAKSIVDYIFRWLGSRFLVGRMTRPGSASSIAPRSSRMPRQPGGCRGGQSVRGRGRRADLPPVRPSAPEPDAGHGAGGHATRSRTRPRPRPSRPSRAVAPKEELAVIATNGHANGHAANGNGAAAKANGNGGGAAPVTLTLGATKVSFQTQADAPSCADCGSIMVRNGSCYKCLNCGSTSGCS